MSFVHLHTHSEYSMLKASLRIKAMVGKALENNQPGIALTDHGCMFGILEFYFVAKGMAKDAGKDFNPIIGCDLFVETPDGIPAKNEDPYDRVTVVCETQEGYNNLMKIVSWIYEGEDSRYCAPAVVPMHVLEEYSKGLIAFVGDYRSRVAVNLEKGRKESANQIIEHYLRIFKDSPEGNPCLYLNLQDMGRPDQKALNEYLIETHKNMNIPVIASNDVHYLNKEDQLSHKILRCIDKGERLDETDNVEFPTDQYYLRTAEEMSELFSHIPEATSNTVDICKRCFVEIKKVMDDSYWPKYEFPDRFKDSDDFLAHMVWEWAPQRYPNMDETTRERIQYELDMMKTMRVAGYMLIVQDFINWARDNDIPVGPGRGSAVGSVVCYIIGIVDVDPIPFSLLFERFLNPERVSMPDIDTDFSDLDRGKVIKYVSEKYGAECVSQIVTYGRLKAKAVIRDVARVLSFPQDDINNIAKLIPADAKNLAKAMEAEEELKKTIEGSEKNKELWKFASSLEGLVRQTGMHAAALIITPQPLSDLAPLYRAEMGGNPVIQYDKTYAEDIGLLKMDFLGLRNLSVIKESLRMIKENHGVELDPRVVDLKDTKTYELLGKGLTVGVFQFESKGMQNYLRQLKPSCIEDMIAMNALYRPGPLENIPSFIARKKGEEEVDCYHDDLVPILGETYGVIVYQEQVMLLAQKLAGFSLGGADLLRRAMAKKKESEMDKLYPQFLNGAIERGYPKELPELIWKVLGPFCAYAFNKSHSAAYAYVGFQTAFLKAHYGPEFMAANMTSEIDSTERLVILMEECRKMEMEIMHPDVNVSMATFTAVDGKINYGLAGIKNVGLSIIEDLVLEREEAGPYKSLFDLCDRILERQNKLMKEEAARTGVETKRAPLNKKVLESLIMAGAMDHMEKSANRASLFASVDIALDYANRSQSDRDSGQVSLFDMGASAGMEVTKEPDFEDMEPWPHTEMLDKEKKVLGLYLSADPLDEFKMEMRGFCHSTLEKDQLDRQPLDNEIVIGGRIVDMNVFPSKQNPNKFLATLTMEDITREQFRFFMGTDLLERVQDRIAPDSMIMVKGQFKERKPKWAKDPDPSQIRISFEPSDIIPIEDARSRWSRFIHLKLNASSTDEQILRDIQDSAETFALDAEMLKDYEYSVCKLVFHLQTASDHVHTLVGNEYMVTAEEEFIDELKDIVGEDDVWFSDRLQTAL